MSVAHKPTRFDEELGKALCDRLGLLHDSTLLDYEAEGSGSHVWVTMHAMKVIPLDEFNGLLRVATERSSE